MRVNVQDKETNANFNVIAPVCVNIAIPIADLPDEFFFLRPPSVLRPSVQTIVNHARHTKIPELLRRLSVFDT